MPVEFFSTGSLCCPNLLERRSQIEVALQNARSADKDDGLLPRGLDNFERTVVIHDSVGGLVVER